MNFTYPKGHLRSTCFVQKCDGVALIAERAGKIAIVREYRPLLGRVLLELPGGMVEGDETPKQAAVRELREEVSALAGNIGLLWQGRPSHTLSTETLHTFYATELVLGPQELAEELVELLWLSPEEIAARLTDISDWAFMDALNLSHWLRTR